MKRFFFRFFISLFFYLFISLFVGPVQAVCYVDPIYHTCSGGCSCALSGTCTCGWVGSGGACAADTSACNLPCECGGNGRCLHGSIGGCTYGYWVSCTYSRTSNPANLQDKCNGYACDGTYPGTSAACSGGSCDPSTNHCRTENLTTYQCNDGNCGACDVRTGRIYCEGLGGCTSSLTGCTHCGDVCSPSKNFIGAANCSDSCYPVSPTLTSPPPPPPATNTPVPPTNTPTPTPTPISTVWLKLKNSSFSSSNSFIDNIPAAPLAYDSDDDATSNFIIGEGGLVSAPSITLTTVNSSAKPSVNDWSVAYSPNPYSFTASSFLSYVKARKVSTKITSLDEINANGIYLASSDITINAATTVFNNYNIVLISTGTISIQNVNFNPSKSVALIAPTINFSDTTTSASGIFIADTINAGTAANQGLKVTGNLIAQTSFVNGRAWSNPNTPAVFIVFDAQKYLDLLPYLSVANYEWRQIQ